MERIQGVTRGDLPAGHRPVGRTLLRSEGGLFLPAWVVERRIVLSSKSGLLLPRSEAGRARAVALPSDAMIRSRPSPPAPPRQVAAPAPRARSRTAMVALLVSALVGPLGFLAGRWSGPDSEPAPRVAQPRSEPAGPAPGRGLLGIRWFPEPKRGALPPVEKGRPDAVAQAVPAQAAPSSAPRPEESAPPVAPRPRGPIEPAVPTDPGEAVALLLELVGSESWNEAGVLLRALLERNPAAEFLDPLLAHTSSQARLLAISMIGLYHRVDSFDAILQLALADPEANVRGAAVGELLGLDPERALGPALQILDSERDPSVLAAALHRLAEVPSAAAGDALLAAFLDGTVDTIASPAGKALARRGGDREARAILARLRQGDLEPARGRQAWRLVARALPYGEFAEEIRQIPAGDDETRLAVADILISNGAPEADRDLVALYRSTSSTEIHGRILRHLARIDTREARAFLAEEAACGETEGHRQTAAHLQPR